MIIIVILIILIILIILSILMILVLLEGGRGRMSSNVFRALFV